MVHANNTKVSSNAEGVKGGLAHHRLIVWHRARELVRMVFGHLPSNAALRDQASRAALSVGLNIAEGAALDGAAGKRHFRIARGSAVEVVAAYELAADIGDNVPLDRVLELGSSLARMLTGLIR